MTQQEFDELYLKENKFTEHIPTYIRGYEKFSKLLVLFSNYIQLVNTQLEIILSQLNLNYARGAILEVIAKRLGISIEKPVDEEGNVNQDLYERQLKIAILGNGLKRNNKADRNSLMKILEIFDSIVRCEIFDPAIYESSQLPMYLDVRLTGTQDTWSSEMLERYVLPKITGVRTSVGYAMVDDNYFGFDTNTVIHIIGSINYTTAEIESDREILYNAAEDLGYAEEDLKTGITITDSNSNNWVYLQDTGSWENSGSSTIEGDLVVDPKLGYSIQGWDKGKWIPTTLIN